MWPQHPYTPKPYNLPPPAIPATPYIPYNASGFGRILTGKLTTLGHTVFSGVYLEKSAADLRSEVRSKEKEERRRERGEGREANGERRRERGEG